MKESWTETVERYLREGRSVSGAKGADTANQQRQQELAMQQDAFATQKEQLATLTKAFSPYLSGNLGFSPQAIAAMQSQFLNNNTSTFNQAGQQVRGALGARGEGQGNLPAGGTYAAGIAPLMAAQASSQSQGLLGLNIQNALQKLTNQFNAGNLLSGNAAILSQTQGVAGNAASNALNSYIQAANSGFGSSFMKGLGGALGGGIGAFATGGLSGGLTSLGSMLGRQPLQVATDYAGSTGGVGGGYFGTGAPKVFG